MKGDTIAQFTPPTVNEAPAGPGPLFMRFVESRGISLVKVNGHFVERRFPSLLDLAGLTQGVDFFLGGYLYEVSDAVAAALTADGFGDGLDQYNDPDVYLEAYA